MTDGIDLSGVLSLLGNGDLASKLTSALGDGGGDLASKLTSALGGEGGDLASKLTSALGGEGGDLASKLMSALGTGAADGGEKSAASESAVPSTGATGIDLPSVVAALTRGGDERSAQRRALLAAIRPFVSDRRRRAIDALVGIEKLTAVLPGVK